MSETSKAIDRVAAEALHGRLRTLGFKRRGRRFAGKMGEAVACVDVQASQWNRPGEARFTVNLGIYFPFLIRLIEGVEPVDFPYSAQCRVPLFERLDHLAKRDSWWQLTTGAEGECTLVAADLAAAWDSHAMAWIANMSQPRKARAKCGNDPGYAVVASALSLLMNEADEARRYVAVALADQSDPARRLHGWIESYAERAGLE